MQTYLDIQAPQDCHSGKALLKVAGYNHPLGSMFDPMYPSIYHGGTHGISFRADHQDVLAWLDLFIEEFPNTRNSMMIIKKDIMRKVRDNLINAYGEIFVRACKLEIRQECQYGSEVVPIFNAEQEWDHHGGYKTLAQ